MSVSKAVSHIAVVGTWRNWSELRGGQRQWVWSYFAGQRSSRSIPERSEDVVPWVALLARAGLLDRAITR